MKDELQIAFGFKIGLQDHNGGEGILVTCSFFSGNAKFDTRGTRILCAEGFIPEFDGNVRLVFQFIGETTSAATCGIWIAVVVK